MTMNSGKTAIVTGASSGIGRASAEALARAGFTVFGTSRRAASNGPDGVTMLACDVTDEASVSKLVDEVLAKAKRIDLLVNNAGIGLLGGAEESSSAQAHALFDVNVFGVLRVTNAVLPTMRRQGKGRIINMSSILGLIPSPFNALYASTKHAIEGYSESLDHELRTFGIRVVLVEPGVTRTSFEENVTRPDRLLPVYDTVRPRMEALMRKWIERGDAPDIVARAVVKAATDAMPRRRYTAGKQAGQVRFLRRFLPESVVDKSLRKINELPA
ncbi:oxidoreductase [Mesorhizobium huakuii]|uniref:Oxidoreductase n=1 Tax=Mesorhizobium huakuii TaxID=28104 RepID=A0A7G6SNG7_9HYPH|nr:oxidoreductase [Mesorhizobium huakuii]QND56049.1 oxidoreductase [Mesorhizobium huakuii]